MSGLDELRKYPLVLWNDSAVAWEMRAAVEMGCRGGTSNPPLILKAAKADDQWARLAAELAGDRSPACAAKALANEIRIAAARELMPVFESTGGHEGRLCVQVDPRNHEDPDAMVAEALDLNRLASNLSVKMPLTSAGLKAMRGALAQGVWVTATVSFTVSQVLAATRMYADFVGTWKGDGCPGLNAVLMVGRVDDYLRVLNEQRGSPVPEWILTQAGVAVAKHAYELLRAEKLPGYLLLAAPRGLYHITEFLEMDAAMTAGTAVRKPAYDSPDAIVPGSAPTEQALQTLRSTFPEFRLAYEPGALAESDFLPYGATQRTLNEFISAQDGLEGFVSECATTASCDMKGL